MSKLYKLIQNEYKNEYHFSQKPEGMKRYKNLAISPKEVNDKRLSAFSEEQKQQILKKYKRWCVYYYFKNEQGKFVKQSSVYFKINQTFKDFDSRYRAIHRLKITIQNLLEGGFSPYDKDGLENEKYTCLSVFDQALLLKKKTISQASFTDYKHRLKQFQKFLTDRGLHHLTIDKITKKDVMEFLNSVLIRSSARNRNNTLLVLRAIFSTLEENDHISYNPTAKIKKLQTKPQRNKTYTKQQEEEIFSIINEKDPQLLLFVKFVSYNFLRPIEVCRLQVKDINFEEKLLSVRAKNKLVKTKIIPQILFDEIQHFKNQPAEYHLFTPNGTGEWKTTETNKRDYWSKRFKEVKDALKLGKDYGLYSFRHTFITKLYRQLRQQYGQLETYDRLMLITGHSTLVALKQYLRDIDAELPQDYSQFLT